MVVNSKYFFSFLFLCYSCTIGSFSSRVLLVLVVPVFLRGCDASPVGLATRLFGFCDAGAALAPRDCLLFERQSLASAKQRFTGKTLNYPVISESCPEGQD